MLIKFYKISQRSCVLTFLGNKISLKRFFVLCGGCAGEWRRRKRVMLIKIRRACRELEIVSAQKNQRNRRRAQTVVLLKKYYYNLFTHHKAFGSKQNWSNKLDNWKWLSLCGGGLDIRHNLNSRVCLCVYALALLTSLFLINSLCYFYVTNSLTLVFVVLVDHNFFSFFLIVYLFLFRWFELLY